MSANMDRLMNNARARLTGATDDALQRELFNVMDDFFKGSNVWNEDIELEVPGQDPAGTEYEITPTGPALIDKLLWVFTKPDQTTISRGSGIRASMQIPGVLVLDTQPSSDVTYIVTVANTVQDPTLRNGYVTFPAWVLDKYRDVILAGLLGGMMMQPSKPYTNNQLAVLNKRLFTQGITAANGEWRRNNTYRMQAWAFPRFVGGTQRGRSGWGGPV